MASGSTDVALVVVTGDTPPGVRLHRLSSQKMVVLCHPDHPVASLAEADLETLRTEPLIGFQAGWGAHMLARRAFAAAGFEYQAAMEVNDVHPLLELVGYNLGVAIVPTSFAQKRPDDLVAVPLPAERARVGGGRGGRRRAEPGRVGVPRPTARRRRRRPGRRGGSRCSRPTGRPAA